MNFSALFIKRPVATILLAWAIFGLGAARAAAPGAFVIQFFGGIHEIYFPYVLMKPILVIAAIAGGMTGVATNAIFGSGLRAPAAPGSIIAVLIQTSSDSNFGPGWGYVGVVLSVILAALVSFLVSALFLLRTRKRDLATEGAGDLSAAIAQTEANKGKSSDALAGLACYRCWMTRLVLQLQFDPENRIGPGKMELLEQIERNGSISAAGRAMNMSYRRAWLLVDAMNRTFHAPVVATRLGGTATGLATLTPLGQEVLALYQEIQRVGRAAVEERIARLEFLIAEGVERSGGPARRRAPSQKGVAPDAGICRAAHRKASP